VANRTPPMLTGNASATIKELIDHTNSDPKRGDDHEKVLTKISIDEATHSILVEKNLTLNSILPFGEIIYLKNTANISSGGTAEDVTSTVNPHTVYLAERIARLVNMDICGIDMVIGDITKPLSSANGAVLEVNASPGLRMHLAPSKGTGRNVAEPVLNMLYPPGTPARIPIVAVTGTNGKTTTTRLIAHMAKTAGYSAGYSSTDGIYIGDEAIHYGDCSGPASAEAILRDPIVDFAVLECARGGILRSGLGFDKCNISIITNITEDHLGLNDIYSLDDLLRVKSVVAHSTMKEGYAILNADDKYVYSLKHKLDCNIGLFSTHANNPRLQRHIADGGLAAYTDNGHFIICTGGLQQRIAQVAKVPLTMEGKATSMIKNILPALLAATASGFAPEQIRRSLDGFVPGPQQTPGRMNIFHFDEFDIMVDYAHNGDGFDELANFLKSTPASKKIGIVTSPGDRRDKDIRDIGYRSARMFNEIIIRHDKVGRGRTNEEITRLIMEGIRKVNMNIPVKVISDECEAVDHCVRHAQPGHFIVLCTEDVKLAIDHLMAHTEKQQHGKEPASYAQ
jgi:cyanophycin synthetase